MEARWAVGKERSTAAPEFLALAERWIREQGETLAMVRYSRAAGSKDFHHFHSPEVFRERVGKLAAHTSVMLPGNHNCHCAVR